MSTLADFEFMSKLGSGSFGQVFRVRRRIDGNTYVLKQVNISEMKHDDAIAATREVHIMASLQSPFVVRYYDSFIDGGLLNIVMENCDGGDLCKAIAASNCHLPGLGLGDEDRVLYLFTQCVLGVAYLHSRRTLHRDLKTANVFLTSSDRLKIGDLGVARVLGTESFFARTLIGTPYYLAPELCKDEPYNEKSDMWALGVVLYEMTTGKHPFDARNQGALILKIIAGRYEPPPQHYSAEITDIVHRLLALDSRCRPSALELLQTPCLMRTALEHGFQLPSALVPQQQTQQVMSQESNEGKDLVDMGQGDSDRPDSAALHLADRLLSGLDVRDGERQPQDDQEEYSVEQAEEGQHFHGEHKDSLHYLGQISRPGQQHAGPGPPPAAGVPQQPAVAHSHSRDSRHHGHAHGHLDTVHVANVDAYKRLLLDEGRAGPNGHAGPARSVPGRPKAAAGPSDTDGAHRAGAGAELRPHTQQAQARRSTHSANGGAARAALATAPGPDLVHPSSLRVSTSASGPRARHRPSKGSYAGQPVSQVRRVLPLSEEASRAAAASASRLGSAPSRASVQSRGSAAPSSPPPSHGRATTSAATGGQGGGYSSVRQPAQAKAAVMRSPSRGAARPPTSSMSPSSTPGRPATGGVRRATTAPGQQVARPGSSKRDVADQYEAAAHAAEVAALPDFPKAKHPTSFLPALAAAQSVQGEAHGRMPQVETAAAVDTSAFVIEDEQDEDASQADAEVDGQGMQQEADEQDADSVNEDREWRPLLHSASAPSTVFEHATTDDGKSIELTGTATTAGATVRAPALSLSLRSGVVLSEQAVDSIADLLAERDELLEDARRLKDQAGWREGHAAPTSVEPGSGNQAQYLAMYRLEFALGRLEEIHEELHAFGVEI